MGVIKQLGNFKFTLQTPDNRVKLEKRAFQKIDADGTHYEGEWIADTKTREGRGVQIWPDGSRYEGYFKQGLCQGFGRLIHADGDSYEG